MKIYLGFNVTSADFDSELSHSKFYHRLMETLKHAYSNRREIGDEKFVDLEKVTLKNDKLGKDSLKLILFHKLKFLEQINSEKYLGHIRSKINDMTTFQSSEYGPFFLKEHHGTGIILFF